MHIEQVPGVGTIIDALRHGLADALGSAVLGAALLFALGASFYFSFALEATPPPQHCLCHSKHQSLQCLC